MRKVKGRLVFSEDVDNKPVPIRNALVQLWDLDLVDNDFLATARTDINGYFDLPYDPSDAGAWLDEPDLVLRLMDREYAYDRDGTVRSNWYVVKSFHLGNDVDSSVLDAGVLRAAFWEYQSPEGSESVAFTPRADVIDGKTPQDQRRGRTNEQLQVGARHLAAHTKHELIAKFSETHPTNEDIEASYPAQGCTRGIGDSAKSDAFLCDLVLNGFNPCLFKKGDSPDQFLVEFRWNGLEQDTTHFAPNTTAYFRRHAGRLELEKIAVQKRIDGNNSAHARYKNPKFYSPADPEWSRVKRIFRCNYFFFGEVTTHLSETHLNVEQYIVAMRRNLLQNPVAQLLFPHFHGTTAVNLAANEILISPTGLVQKCSAATPASVAHAAVLNFGTLNWKDWRPRKPICAQHRFAKLGELYWDVLEHYVAEFFAANAALIEAYWHEVHRMSDDLLAHALPFRPIDDSAYYDTGELNTASSEHPRIRGEAVALSPVTRSDTPDPAGLANLRQVCAYLLYHATFKHSWVNDLQYLMGGEIEFATLSISDDITNMRVDENVVVPPSEAMEHPFVTYILNYTEYGYLFRNEDDDINPRLLQMLAARRREFTALNYDIRTIRSCINT